MKNIKQKISSKEPEDEYQYPEEKEGLKSSVKRETYEEPFSRQR